MLDMIRAHSFRFIPAAVLFLLICVSVLFLAASTTFVPFSWNESHAEILSTLLR
jgi:hypothetical protein